MKQVTPPDITGTGSGFAAGGSVLDHSFGKGDPFTLGVEEEYMLLDAETFDLVQHIDTVLAAVEGSEPHLPPARPFRDFLAWLERQDGGEAERFCRATLAGYGRARDANARSRDRRTRTARR